MTAQPGAMPEQDRASGHCLWNSSKARSVNPSEGSPDCVVAAAAHGSRQIQAFIVTGMR